MNKKFAITTICLIMFSFLFTTSLFATEAEVITITGIVIGLYDDADKLVLVSIQDSDDGSFHDVSPQGKGNELLDLIDKKVKVTGIIVKDEDGFEILNVQSYTILTD
jgi:hypothetical protein